MEVIKIAILGHGTIGGGVSRILLENSEELSRKAGKKLEVVGLCTKDPEPDQEFVNKYGHLFCEADEALNNPEVSIICETIGGTGVALQFVKQALASGKHVVTANKKMIALHYEELMVLAKQHNVSLFFEAAVGGGIPLLSSLRTGLPGDEVLEIEGILNGTTNFILTKMEETGAEFTDVLKEAQQLGYAEADPTDDIDGFDAAYKLSILMILAFQKRIMPKAIPTTGIANISTADFSYAKQFGKKIKLMASAKKTADNVSAQVCPVMLNNTARMSGVSGVLNAANFIGKYNLVGNFLSGEGAGRFATAAAIVSDIVAITRGESPYLPEPVPVKENSVQKQAYYMRFQVSDRPGIVGDIGVILGKHGVSIDAVDQQGGQHGPIHFAVTTFPVEVEQFQQALEEINSLEFNVDQVFVMPIKE